MKHQLLSGYVGDMLVAAVAIVVGLLATLYFHTNWYHGWMDLFGDPPMGNSSYSKFAPLFEAAPYVAGGLAAGIIAGFGRPLPICLLVRATAPGFLYFLLSSKNAGLADRVFVPSVLAAFSSSPPSCLPPIFG